MHAAKHRFTLLVCSEMAGCYSTERMRGRNAIIFLLVMLPQLSLADLSATGIITSCQSTMGDCKAAMNGQTSVSTSLIKEICTSDNQGAELACYSIVGRALDLNSELPVDYLKDECFGSSPKTKTICKEIRTLCNEHKNSASCSELIPKNTNSATMVKHLLMICQNSEDDCEVSAKQKATAITADEVAEICKSTHQGSNTACHHIVQWTIGKEKKISVDFWKSTCGQKPDEYKKFCDEITDVCSSNPESSICDEIKKATVTEEKSDSTMLITIVAGAAVVILGIATAIFLLRKKIFKGHYAKKNPKKGADKDKKKKKKKKTGSKGSAADSEVTTEGESAQVSAQGSAAGQPSTEKKEES